jgi:hypothetical protein
MHFCKKTNRLGCVNQVCPVFQKRKIQKGFMAATGRQATTEVGLYIRWAAEAQGLATILISNFCFSSVDFGGVPPYLCDLTGQARTSLFPKLIAKTFFLVGCTNRVTTVGEFSPFG